MQNQENGFNNQQGNQTQEPNHNMKGIEEQFINASNQNPQFTPNGIYNQNPQFVPNGSYNQNPQFMPNGNYNQNPQFAPNGNYNQNPQFAQNGWQNLSPEEAARKQESFQAYLQQLEKKTKQKKDLKKLGNLTGFALLSYVFIQSLCAIFLELFGGSSFYLTSATFETGYNIFVVILSIAAAFAFFGIKMNKVSGVKEPIQYDAPKDKKQLALAIFSGLGLCMIANYITVYFVLFLSMFGINLSSPDITTTSLSIIDVILTYIQVVIVASVVEEISLRGFTMGNLKQFGIKFAIFASAVIFGLMHANFVQAPFALIVGLGLGYLTIKTRSVWTGIIIHSLNNFISITVSYMYLIMDENVINSLYTIFTYALIIIGIICFTQFVKRSQTEAIDNINPYDNLSFAQKCRAYFGAPVMIVALIYFISVSFSYVSFG
ncbi:MAG: type II CAAX endopeptidase family protein [Clostridia bacterium]